MTDSHAGRSRDPGRNGDEALVRALAADGFAGPGHRLFERSLAAYAYPVMMTLIREGHIFRECAAKGRPLPASPELLVQMATSLDTAQQLAGTTVAEALPRFRESALVKGGWRADGGTSLRGYFVGACVLAFPNVYRKWLKAFQEREAELQYGLMPDEFRLCGAAPDHADSVVLASTLRQSLRTLPPDTAHALERIVVDGVSLREAASESGMSEATLRRRLRDLQKSETWRYLEWGSRG
jgi:hypothetical protein